MDPSILTTNLNSTTSFLLPSAFRLKFNRYCPDLRIFRKSLQSFWQGKRSLFFCPVFSLKFDWHDIQLLAFGNFLSSSIYQSSSLWDMIFLYLKVDDIFPDWKRVREQTDSFIDNRQWFWIASDFSFDFKGQFPYLLTLALLEVPLTKLPSFLILLKLVFQPNRLKDALSFRIFFPQQGQFLPSILIFLHHNKYFDPD